MTKPNDPPISEEEGEELVLIATCGSSQEARLYQGALIEAGIPCYLLDIPDGPLLGVPGGAMASIVFGQEAELRVPLSREDEAITLLEEVSKETEAGGDLIGDAWKQGG